MNKPVNRAERTVSPRFRESLIKKKKILNFRKVIVALTLNRTFVRLYLLKIKEGTTTYLYFILLDIKLIKENPI